MSPINKMGKGTDGVGKKGLEKKKPEILPQTLPQKASKSPILPQKEQNNIYLT